jgi:hypothetical protein
MLTVNHAITAIETKIGVIFAINLGQVLLEVPIAG